MIVPKRIRVDKAGVVSWRNEEGGRASTVTTIHAPAGEFVDARIADEMLAALKVVAERRPRLDDIVYFEGEPRNIYGIVNDAIAAAESAE